MDLIRRGCSPRALLAAAAQYDIDFHPAALTLESSPPLVLAGLRDELL